MGLCVCVIFKIFLQGGRCLGGLLILMHTQFSQWILLGNTFGTIESGFLSNLEVTSKLDHRWLFTMAWFISRQICASLRVARVLGIQHRGS